MIKIHTISDYYLGFNEFTNDIDETLPECDLVIVIGNMGTIKRSMIYVEYLCKKYPEKQFIVSMGRSEDGLHRKNDNEIIDGMNNRQLLSDLWPKNLRYEHNKPIRLTINDRKIEVMCFHGFPHITEETIDDSIWKSTQWYKYASHGVTKDPNEFKHKDASDVYHGWFPKYSTPERCRVDHNIEYEIIKRWVENKPEDTTQILVTALYPKNDPCMGDIEYTMYPGIKPDVWIASGVQSEDRSDNHILYGNPGRSESARKAVLVI